MGTCLNDLQTLVKSVSNEENESCVVLSENVNPSSIAVSTQNMTASELPLANAEKRALSKKKWKDQHKASVNASERDRKGRLSTCIAKLKQLLPACKANMTKEAIIEKSINFIKDLQQKHEDMLKTDAPECLLNELSALRKQVLELKEQEKVYQSLLASHAIPANINVQKKPKVPIVRRSKAKSALSEATHKDKTAVTEAPTSTNQVKPTANIVKPLPEVASNGQATAVNNLSRKESGFESINSTSNDLTDVNNNGMQLARQMMDIMLLLCLVQQFLNGATFPSSKNKTISSDVTAEGDKGSTITHPSERNTTSEHNTITKEIDTAKVSTSPPTDELIKALSSPKSTPDLQSNLTVSPNISKSGSSGEMETPSVNQIPTVSTPRQTKALSPDIERPSTLQIEKISDPTLPEISPSPQADNLLAWLRSSEDTSMDAEATTVPTVSTSLQNRISGSAAIHTGKDLVNSRTPFTQKRSNMNSFDIANLMKPSDVNTDTATSTTAAGRTKDHVDSDVIEFNAASSCDITQQSFENDILDCLQGLTTPEPPSRHGAGKLDAFMRVGINTAERGDQLASDTRKRDQSISNTLNEFLYPDSVHCPPVDAPSPYAVSVASRSHVMTPRVLNTSETPVGKIVYPNPHHLHHQTCPPQNSQQTAPSLWQPAIAELTPNKQLSAVGFSDCFSPMSSHYISHQSTPHFHQRLLPSSHSTRISQSLAPSVSWMPSNKQTVATVSTTLHTTHVRSTAAQAVRTEQTKPTPTKKRKASKQPQSSRKKKHQVKDTSTTHCGLQPTATPDISQRAGPRTQFLHPQSNTTPIRFYHGNDNSRRMYPAVQNLNQVVGHTPVTYNPDLGSQSNLFHQQGVAYPGGPPNPYFPYNTRIPQNQQINYVPGFANANNSNNSAQSEEAVAKSSKASQHHIKRILA
uniref:Orphan bHLH-4 transcription factor protein n=1 Tax=Phallusia mammillata TaxID=59560 RepID=A0A6F9D831_9ASCI|nr:Orphan bHLH-4 transcription factor protein [Phallusia mammillata]